MNTETQLVSDAESIKAAKGFRNCTPWWTLSPAAIWMILLFVLPMIMVLIVSFLTRSAFGGIKYVFTFENYTRFFDPLYLRILWVSCEMAFLTTACCLLVGYPFAYYLAKSRPKYRNMLLLLVIVPFWTNSLIRTYAWIMLLRTEGVINTVLLHLGLIQHPIPMLYNDTSVLIGLVYTMLPFMILPLYASIEKLDGSLLEAASDLGAKPRQTFWQVTLPLTAPGIIAGTLLVFVPSLGLFFIPDLMGGSKSVLIGNLIKNQFLTARDWPFGSAISIILLTLTLIFLAFYVTVSKDKEGKGLV